MKEIITKRIFKATDIATIFDVEHDTAQKWLASGALRSFRTKGGHYRIHRADLIKFLTEQKKHVAGLTAPCKTRILIVEDDAMVARFIRRILQSKFPSVEIHNAIEGYEAGFKTLLLKPALVVLDLMLPGLNGIRICKMLRADKSLSELKILAISGYRPDRIGRTILKAGANFFHAKPLDSRKFLDAVTQLIGIPLQVEGK